MNGFPWPGVNVDDSAFQALAAVGFRRDTINSWRRRDTVPAKHADTFAITLGRHPTELWDDFHDETHHPRRDRRK